MKLNYLKKSVLLLAILLGASAYAQDKAQGPVVLSLKQAQEYALANNVKSKNASLDLELAKKKIWETTAIGLPQVNLQASYQHLFTVPELSFGGSTFLTTDLTGTTPITAQDILNESVYLGYKAAPALPLGVKDNTTFNFSVSQLLFSGEYLVGLQASRVFYLMSDQSKISADYEIRESVANTYALALVVEQSYKTLSESLANLKKTESEMKEMYQQGFIENTDVDQIELTYLNLSNAVNALQRQISATSYLLKFQLGMPFDTEIILSDNLDAMAGGVTLESMVTGKFDVKQNITFQMLETQEKLGSLNLKREMSGYLPNIAAVYQHTEKTNKPEFDFNPKDVLAVSLNLPLFTSGQRHVKVQQRRIELEKVTNTKDDLANGLQLEYKNTTDQLANTYESYVNSKKNVELTDRIYEKTLIKYKEGLSTSMDLTRALDQNLTARRDYYTAIYNLLSAKNKLDKLTNKL